METPPEDPQKTRRFRPLWRILSVLALLYVGLLGLLYVMQDKIVFPGHDTQGSESSVVLPLPGTELVHLKTADGALITGLFGFPLTAQLNPLTVLYFYGNGDCMNESMGEFKMLRELGANVMMADYTGYGMSGGRPSEKGLYQTADAAYDYLVQTKHTPPNRLIIMGRSIGGAVATDLASRRPAQGLITFSAFTSLPNVAGASYPFLPVASLIRYRFDNESKIPRVAYPILIAHGQKDTLVPFSMSERLAKAAKSHVTRLTLPKSGHDDVFDTEKPLLRAGIRDFLQTRK